MKGILLLYYDVCGIKASDKCPVDLKSHVNLAERPRIYNPGPKLISGGVGQNMAQNDERSAPSGFKQRIIDIY
jgi:hypothetical protein